MPVSRTVRPESVEELAEFLASEEGAVVPVGAATQLGFGNPLRRAEWAVDLTALSQITEYNPADLTIHLQAGTTLQQLEHALSENKQFLPLDPWNGTTATLGGIAATDAQGPFRAAGTIRDWIIGMKVVHANGRISKTGGRVVKNVTGYDVAKLYTGSIGTLAIIVEISLKLRAQFGRMATVIARTGGTADAAALIASVRNSPLQPVSCEWIGPENEVWLRFGEHPDAVEWQLKNLPPAEWTLMEGREEAGCWERLRSRYLESGPVTLKVIALPTTMREVIDECRPSAWIAHALNGVILMQFSEADDIPRIRQTHRTVIEKAPLDIRRRIPTFGLTDSEYEVMNKLKSAFDPDGRLNPGRHVDGERG